MSSTPILFQFSSQDAALLAQDTLEELGYRVSRHSDASRPTLHVIVDRHDLTSALEIAQAHGGELTEGIGSYREDEAYTLAYDPDGMVPIPAHTVNEDWSDEAPVRTSGAY